LLADIDRAAGPHADTLDRGKRLAAATHRILQLVGDVEMILDRTLVAAGDEDDLSNARLKRLLDQRFVDDDQHLLGDRLGGREEARAQPGDWKDCLAYRPDIHTKNPRSGTAG
jgi:hypothetical protein